jgi:glutathione S-transferase
VNEVPEYVDLEAAKTASGLRLLTVAGVPSPWGEALKGICRVKQIPHKIARIVPGHADGELIRWTAQSSLPVAVYNDERPRSSWIDQLYLAERLGPEPGLIPGAIADRIEMFGQSNELCGENGLGWLRRLTLLDISLARGDQTGMAKALGAKYGYSKLAAESAPAKTAEILRHLAARLAEQKQRGSKFLIGERLSALDIYWATFAALIDPLPREVCTMPRGLHALYGEIGPVVKAALDPSLIAHRDFIYREYLKLPLEL